ncbi:ribonuclease 3 [Anaerocolumna cellulosilytica]|uniref:Ribonuclease 3 n=1 Tax=Anaerocolumna cellulosilytica TaxID=433286 RepID=A0A6S6R198_9FIRM|nr:ribonuclease III [Anaerocolumna cellulosilytica]MBB5197584.1 ribonuclease-3 [Anaerocolumna cellulosilytica]BCJ95109.1 ribonuclease 3 [Anaerocolumna cellulosilytica]
MNKSEELILEKLRKFEDIIDYRFRDRKILKHALTHSSYANEKRMNKLDNNERLEFLGDAVLELVTSEYLFQKNSKMPEGDLTKLRARLVCEQTLAACARDIRVGTFLLLGKGEAATGGRDRLSILSDAMEAIIGAIYLDGGFTNAKEFICKYILSDVENKKLFFDSKTILQEIVQSEFKEQLSYELIKEEGPDHNKQFTVVALVNDLELGVGVGKTKKAAEQEAAYQSILKMNKKKMILPGESLH